MTCKTKDKDNFPDYHSSFAMIVALANLNLKRLPSLVESRLFRMAKEDYEQCLQNFKSNE